MSRLEALLEDEPVEQLDWPFAALGAARIGDHLSASSIAQFQRCPEQFRRVYLLGERERPGAAMVWGSADHYAHEQNFKQKIDTGTDIAVDDVKLACAEGFDVAVDQNGGESEIIWGDDKPATLKDKAIELVGVYHTFVSPTIQPLAVEERFEVTLPGVPVPVIGFIDLRSRPPEVELGPRVGIERKTAARSEKKIKPQWRIQGLLYQAVTAEPVDWHISVKTKTPAVCTPSSPDSEGLRLPVNNRMIDATKVLVQNTARAMLAYWRMYGPNEPWPGAITHPWACDFCGFRPSCSWWGN